MGKPQARREELKAGQSAASHYPSTLFHLSALTSVLAGSVCPECGGRREEGRNSQSLWSLPSALTNSDFEHLSMFIGHLCFLCCEFSVLSFCLFVGYFGFLFLFSTICRSS